MLKPTLLILAAGMGSRYGGVKQLDQLGPGGETIMDYSVRYAIENGYGRAVFVIRRSIEADFKAVVLPRYADKIQADYVFQELDCLPEGFRPDPERKKPYGTAHAILAAKDAIHEPFTVINADDFYGSEAFRVMADFLRNNPAATPPAFAMVGYRLDRTLSEHGTVSRGVCTTTADGYLHSIVERRKVGRTPDGIADTTDPGHPVFYRGDEPVSMNFWGFTPEFFQDLNGMFADFLRKNAGNPKAEFTIPDVIGHFMTAGKAVVKVLHTDSEWFGITYQEDRPSVVEKLKALQQRISSNAN